MKKTILILTILILIIIEINAQDYTISFANENTIDPIDSVLIENLTNGYMATIRGSNTLLLTSENVLGIPKIKQFQNISVYPNPGNDFCFIDFCIHRTEKVTIMVSTIDGKSLIQETRVLDAGLQAFKLEGIGPGLFLVNLFTSEGNYSAKFINFSASEHSVKLIHLNTQSDNDILTTKSVTDQIKMHYTDGERLKFTFYSLKNISVKTEIPTDSKIIGASFFEAVDKNGKNYKTVKIGNQIWMAENLAATYFVNGDIIPTTTPFNLDITNENSPVYQWAYEGNEDYATTYGRLYTNSVAIDNRGVCPAGWHVSTAEDWDTLVSFLGNKDGIGNILKEVGTKHWNMSSDQTDEFGFSALPGGDRLPNGEFINITHAGIWWTKSYTNNMITHIGQWAGVNFDQYAIMDVDANSAFSIRCVKNVY